MTTRTTAQLIEIAQNGGGFELDATAYSVDELNLVAHRMCNGSTMRLRNTDQLTNADLALIAQHAPPGVVQFIF